MDGCVGKARNRLGREPLASPGSTSGASPGLRQKRDRLRPEPTEAQELIRTQAQQLRQNETENHAMALDASKRNNAEKTRLAEAHSYGKDAQQKLKAEVTAQMSTERAELRENMIKGLQDEFSTGLAPLINDARSKISSGLKLVRNPLPATFRAAAAFRSGSPSPSPSRGPSPTPMMAGFDAEE